MYFTNVPLLAQVSISCKSNSATNSPNAFLETQFNTNMENSEGWQRLGQNKSLHSSLGNFSTQVMRFSKDEVKENGVCAIRVKFVNCENFVFDDISLSIFEGDETEFLKKLNRTEIINAQAELRKTFEFNYELIGKLYHMSMMVDLALAAFETASMANPIHYELFTKAIERMEQTVDKTSVAYQQLVELKESFKQKSDPAKTKTGENLKKGLEVLSNVGNIVLGGRLSGAIGLFKNLFNIIYSKSSMMTNGGNSYKVVRDRHVDSGYRISENEIIKLEIEKKVSEAVEEYGKLKTFLDEIQIVENKMEELRFRLSSNFSEVELAINQVEQMLGKEYGLLGISELSSKIAGTGFNVSDNIVRLTGIEHINKLCNGLLDTNGGGKILTDSERAAIGSLKLLIAKRTYYHEYYVTIASAIENTLTFWMDILRSNPFTDTKSKVEWNERANKVIPNLENISEKFKTTYVNYVFAGI